MRLKTVIRNVAWGVAIAGLTLSASPSFAQLSPAQLKAQRDRAARDAAARARAERERVEERAPQKPPRDRSSSLGNQANGRTGSTKPTQAGAVSNSTVDVPDVVAAKPVEQELKLDPAKLACQKAHDAYSDGLPFYINITNLSHLRGEITNIVYSLRKDQFETYENYKVRDDKRESDWLAKWTPIVFSENIRGATDDRDHHGSPAYDADKKLYQIGWAGHHYLIIKEWKRDFSQVYDPAEIEAASRRWQAEDPAVRSIEGLYFGEEIPPLYVNIDVDKAKYYYDNDQYFEIINITRPIAPYTFNYGKYINIKGECRFVRNRSDKTVLYFQQF